MLVREYKYWNRDTSFIINWAYIGGQQVLDKIDNILDLVQELKRLMPECRIGIDIIDADEYSTAFGYKFCTWKITWWDAKWFIQCENELKAGQ